MKTIIIIISFLIFSDAAKGQLVANFTTSDGNTGGCSPYIVIFKNLTTGASPNAIYDWDLGDNNASSAFNPGVTYITEKKYTVTLTVTDNGIKSSKSLDITVYKKPTANFSVDKTEGCTPITVNYKSNSVANSGTITNYFWDFGDGFTTTSFDSTPVAHTYTVSQKLSAVLIVTNSFGCQNSIQKMNIVNAVAPPSSIFVSNKNILCNLSDSVNFKTITTNDDIVTYLWDFGDGITSTHKSPYHKYTKKGNYDIKLIVTNATSSSCSSTSIQPALINASDYKSDFTISSPICNNANTVFQNKSLPAPILTKWYFSSDNFQTAYISDNISKTFNVVGKLSIKLVNSFSNCYDSIQKDVVVNPAPSLQGFITNYNSSCGAPVIVTFQDTCSSSFKWKWNFNASDMNAVSYAQTASYTYTSNNNFIAALTVTDSEGCISTVTKNIAIQKPSLDISIINSTGKDTIRGCPGFSVTFAATNASIVSNYIWDFGDGSTSFVAQPSHVFLQPGSYFISLSYTTNGGCSGKIIFNKSIAVNQKPKADFTFSPNNSCKNGKIIFSDISTPQTDRWLWSFGDNTSSSLSSSNKSISHQYTDSGSFSVTLIAYNGGCSDTIQKNSVVHVLPPFTKITSVNNTCDGNRSIVSLSQSSKYGTQCNWDFGDGSTQSININQTQVNHDYKKTGKYKAILTSFYNDCVAIDSTIVYVLTKQQPALAVNKTELCGSDTLQVKVQNLSLNPYQKTNGYIISKWLYDDSSIFKGASISSNNNWSNIYTGLLTGLKSGRAAILSIIQSSYFGCYDTALLVPVKIDGPSADFLITNNNTCYKSSLIFTDTSSINNSNNIVTRTWNFGDTKDSLSTQEKSITHKYNDPGNYSVSLKVVDNTGCFAIAQGTNAIIKGPKTNFNWSPTQVNPGVATIFLNTTNAANTTKVSYAWKFNNNNFTDTCSSKVIYKYRNISLDTVSLIATDANSNCSDTSIQYVPINKMNIDLNYSSKYVDSNNCPPLILYVNTTGKISNADSISWKFGDGSISGNTPNPIHTYYQPGIYTFTLYGYINDIVDSVCNTITINGPYAILHANAYQKCTPANITLYASLRHAISYAWDFNDGILLQTTDTIVEHNYAKPGLYNPSFVMKDSAGCSSVFNLPQKILMDTLSASIFSSAQTVCDSTTVSFNSNVFNYASNYPNENLNYKWFFGTPDNATDTTEDADFMFTKSGTYIVTLLAKSTPGCIVQTSDTIYVNPLPLPFEIGPDLFIESNTSIILTPSITENDLTYSWTPSLFLSSETVLNPVCTPLSSQTYFLTATTNSGCSRTDSIKITVLGKINIPNAFSPNGDGINDFWEIKYLENYPGATVDIYNRSGQTVFHSNGYNIQWDGKIHGEPLPIGTYYYIINLKNNKPPLSGSVTIIR